MSANTEEKVFNTLGLSRKIDYGNQVMGSSLNGSDFLSFVRKDYTGSPELATDEHHRMFETIRIHMPTGLRFFCLSHESYDGQSVEYTLFNAHIITSDGRTLPVIGIDRDKQLMTTPGDEVAFSNISREQD